MKALMKWESGAGHVVQVPTEAFMAVLKLDSD